MTNRHPQVAPTILVAVANNGVIGKENGLPWRLSSDLQRFRHLTMGHALIMGRKTFDSIGKALPGRHTIVISRTRTEYPEGISHASSIEQALQLVQEPEHPFIVGGAEIYRQSWPLVKRICLTRVLADVPGDATIELPLPSTSDKALRPSQSQPWRLVATEFRPADSKNDWPTRYEEWVRDADLSLE